MTTLHKKAHIPHLRGILLSDPSYASDVWCRYEAKIAEANWRMELTAADMSDDGYLYTDFALVLARPETADLININPDLSSFSRPKSLKASKHTIGMDSACVYLGQSRVLDQSEWQPSCALRTGTDGEFGGAFELSDETGTVAVVLLGYIDGHFGTKESLWSYLKSAFEAVEE